MEYQAASPKQIDVFVKAALARYAERGIAPDKAEDLLAKALTKQAEALGISVDEPTPMQKASRVIEKCMAKRASQNRVSNYKEQAIAAIASVK